MPLIPPNPKSKPASKPRARRKPAAATRGDIDISPAALSDTPSPPTEPIPEPEPVITRAATKPRAGTLEARLKETFASLSVLPSFVGDSYSSFIIASRSEKFAHDLAELAKVNPRVKRILENMLDGGAMGGVAFSGAAMVLPILWSYGIIPAPPFDPFSPFYPQLPNGIAPRSAQREASRSNSGRVAAPAGPSGDGPAGAPGTIPGVVTVKPGAHPPVNPAAGQ